MWWATNVSVCQITTISVQTTTFKFTILKVHMDFLNLILWFKKVMQWQYVATYVVANVRFISWHGKRESRKPATRGWSLHSDSTLSLYIADPILLSSLIIEVIANYTPYIRIAWEWELIQQEVVTSHKHYIEIYSQYMYALKICFSNNYTLERDTHTQSIDMMDGSLHWQFNQTGRNNHIYVRAIIHIFSNKENDSLSIIASRR